MGTTPVGFVTGAQDLSSDFKSVIIDSCKCAVALQCNSQCNCFASSLSVFIIFSFSILYTPFVNNYKLSGAYRGGLSNTFTFEIFIVYGPPCDFRAKRAQNSAKIKLPLRRSCKSLPVKDLRAIEANSLSMRQTIVYKRILCSILHCIMQRM